MIASSIAILASLASGTLYLDAHVEMKDEPAAVTAARLRAALLHRLAEIDVEPRCFAGSVMYDAAVVPILERKIMLELEVIPPTGEIALDDELRDALSRVCRASRPSYVEHRTVVSLDERAPFSHTARAPDIEECDDADHEGAIMQITMRRGACLGTCPVDAVEYNSDGAVAYEGTRFVSPVGKRSGHLPVARFRELAHALDAAGFFCMTDSYEKSVTDNPGIVVSATTSSSRKRVLDYAFAAPNSLAKIEVMMTTLLDEVRWNEAKQRPP